MPIYRLEYRLLGANEDRIVEYEAASSAFALCIAESEPLGSHAVLFQDGAELCRRGESPAGTERCWVLA